MKINFLWAGIVLLAMSCTEKPAFVLEGTVEGYTEDLVYLYSIKNEYYKMYEVIDSARVENGHFRMERMSLRPELYFLGKNGYEDEIGETVFLEPGQLKATGKKNKAGEWKWNIQGSKNQDQYALFKGDVEQKTGKVQRDSLDNLFFVAREKEDQEEMRRIKEVSLPLYVRADSLTRVFADQYSRANRDKAVGLYLYQRYRYSRDNCNDTVSIAKVKEYVNQFGPEAKSSIYYERLMDNLDKLDKVAVGRVAPEIMGKDTLGNEIKLSDFRGKYVLVDFWNSYCHWCREESPNMRKALAVCGDRFTVLGISNDPEKDLWMEAIHKDKAYWNHMWVDEETALSLYDTYGILGIPHIFLVNPEGVIVAKEVRGQDIIDTPKRFLGI